MFLEAEIENQNLSTLFDTFIISSIHAGQVNKIQSGYPKALQSFRDNFVMKKFTRRPQLYSSEMIWPNKRA